MKKYYRVIYKYKDEIGNIGEDTIRQPRYYEKFLKNKKEVRQFLDEENKQILFTSRKKYTIDEFETFHSYSECHVEQCYLNNKIICIKCREEVNLDQEEQSENNIHGVVDYPDKT